MAWLPLAVMASASFSDPGGVLERVKLQVGPKPQVEVKPPELRSYSGPALHPDGRGRLVFAYDKARADDGGRVELRQLAEWSVGDSQHALAATLAVTRADVDEVTLLQIHDAALKPTKPLLRIAWRRARGKVREHLWAVVRTALSGDAYEHLDLGPLALGADFDARITVAKGRLDVSANGVTLESRDVSYWSVPSYFKAGCYPQSAGRAEIAFTRLELE